MDSSSPPPFAYHRPADPVEPAEPVLRFADGAAEFRVPVQPTPTRVSVNHFRLGSSCVTSIYRRWAPGDSGPSGRCRRCPACTSDGVSCHISVGKYIPPEDAPSFALADLPGALRQDR